MKLAFDMLHDYGTHILLSYLQFHILEYKVTRMLKCMCDPCMVYVYMGGVCIDLVNISILVYSLIPVNTNVKPLNHET